MNTQLRVRFKAADIITAIITPFTTEGKIDYAALEKLTNRLLATGTRGFVIGGTTGEGPTLTHDEKMMLYQRFAQMVGGRGVVIAGTGSNNTAQTVAFTREVAAIPGIDAALVVVPYYNKPSQAGMVAHFTAVAQVSELPIMIYNIPGRTGVEMEPATVARLANVAGIIGIKQCSSLEKLEQIVDQAPSDFLVYSGEDVQALSARTIGANGIISVAAHVYGEQMRAMYDELMAGNISRSGQLQRWLTPRMEALFMFPSPTPVKTVLAAQNSTTTNVRLPLVPLEAAEQAQLAEALGLSEDAFTHPLPLNLGGPHNENN